MSMQMRFEISKSRLMAGAGLVLLLFLFWIEGAFESKTGPGTQPKESLSSAHTLTVSRKSTEGVIAWPARIEALKTIQVSTKYPGRIMEILVTPGSHVNRGQPLVRLDTSEMQARLSQAKAHLSASEAAFSRARADAHRMRNLFTREAVTRQALDAVATEERQAQAGVQEARGAVKLMESELAETQLLAPYEGIVERRLREPGDLVLQGQAILTFLQAPVLRIEASLPATCAAELKMGEAVQARMPDGSGLLTAVVDEIEPAKDRETQTQLIKARLSSETQAIPGSFLWLERACGTESLMLIPANAIRRIGQLESISILKGGQQRTRHIRTGRQFGQNIEVLSGLNEGDQVVIPNP